MNPNTKHIMRMWKDIKEKGTEPTGDHILSITDTQMQICTRHFIIGQLLNEGVSSLPNPCHYFGIFSVHNAVLLAASWHCCGHISFSCSQTSHWDVLGSLRWQAGLKQLGFRPAFWALHHGLLNSENVHALLEAKKRIIPFSFKKCCIFFRFTYRKTLKLGENLEKFRFLDIELTILVV